jgi:hypothetical protein
LRRVTPVRFVFKSLLNASRKPSDLHPNALHSTTGELKVFHLSLMIAFNRFEAGNPGRWRWRRERKCL